MTNLDTPSGQRALVLGATGGIGGEVARQLRDDGWQVQALKRGQDEPVIERGGITWLRGDAMNRDEVLRAAQGCSVIVHAVNPPGYRHWGKLVLPMLDNTIAAARAQHATIVLPGTVYNYGPDAFPLLDEESPQRPLTRKGAIRVEMEQRLQAATTQGARVIIVRAGDFFGPRAGNSWFSQGVVQPGKLVKIIRVPGDRGVGHQWSYLPDVARTMVALLARREKLAPFARFHMAGHWDADGMQMAEAIRGVAQRHGLQPKIAPFSWGLVRMLAPFIATLRELQEMRYLWREPVRMDGTRLRHVLGAEPHTPLEEAIEATLRGLQCLPRENGSTAARPDSRASATCAPPDCRRSPDLPSAA